MSVAENLDAVRTRMAAVASRAGRNPKDIRLMAVSKMVEAARIQQAYDAGVRLFGENRVQEFSAKIGELRLRQDVEWHLIGHLQSNKAASAAELFHAIDSIDSLRLAEKLNAGSQKSGKRLAALLEINLGEEPSKSGLGPGSPELEAVLAAAPKLKWLQIRGLMAIPPFDDDPEKARPYFCQLRQLRDRIAARHWPAVVMDELSMGMSHDFEVAIEEGSTCVRIGTAIFGPRPKPASRA